MFVIQNQPNGTLAHFRGKLVRRLAHDASFSQVGASGKPGTVQLLQTKPQRSPCCGAEMTEMVGFALRDREFEHASPAGRYAGQPGG